MEKSVYDVIGPWSEIKLEIIKRYAAEYTKILNKKNFKFLYIDAFAGGGLHLSKATGDYVLGSPLNALNVHPRFHEFHLIDLDEKKAESLKELVGNTPNVFIYRGDCNKVLLEKVFPRASYRDYRRALCILDPYGLQLEWDVMRMAGQMKSIEIFLNFPIMHINRNVLRKDRNLALPADIARMNKFWGDDSWNKSGYFKEQGLFGEEEIKAPNESIVEAFRKRLKDVAGFSYVSKPMAMRNKQNAVVYYLLFAARIPVAKKIVDYLFGDYNYGKKAY